MPAVRSTNHAYSTIRTTVLEYIESVRRKVITFGVEAILASLCMGNTMLTVLEKHLLPWETVSTVPSEALAI